jgi:hypothetical protein
MDNSSGYITFGSVQEEYYIPDLNIAPEFTTDEHLGVCRVSLRFPLPLDQKSRTFLQELNERREGMFISDIHFCVDTIVLSFRLAAIFFKKQQDAVFIDIESALEFTARSTIDERKQNVKNIKRISGTSKENMVKYATATK